jgi:hypothetical protein
MWTGMRIVAAWSAMARVIACRIHHVAYVENLKPFSKSNFSTARMRPMLPSWMRSRKDMPRPMYFFAIDTTSRRLAEVSCSRASRPIRTSSPLRCASLVFFGHLRVVAHELEQVGLVPAHDQRSSAGNATPSRVQS